VILQTNAVWQCYYFLFSNYLVFSYLFIYRINIFVGNKYLKRLSLDLCKKILQNSRSALRKKSHKFYHLQYNSNALVMCCRD